MFAKMLDVKGHMGLNLVLLMAALALITAVAAQQLWAKDDVEEAPVPLKDARMIIEFNSTAEDTGIQVFLDGEPWNQVRMVGPKGRNPLLEVAGRGTLRGLGLTELFFESNEPSLEDLPLEDFKKLFPEGKYRFFADSVEGPDQVGEAIFTHKIPSGPVIISPGAGLVDPNNTIIDWNPVTTPAGINVVAYQVIVERDGLRRPFSVHLPGTVTMVKVPPQFMESNKEYKFEVLAIEVGGNQTITEGLFQTQ